MSVTHFYLNIFLGLIVLAAIASMVLNRKSKDVKLADLIGGIVIGVVAGTLCLVSFEDAHNLTVSIQFFFGVAFPVFFGTVLIFQWRTSKLLVPAGVIIVVFGLMPWLFYGRYS